MTRSYSKNDIDFFVPLKLRQKELRPKGHPVRAALIAVAAAALLFFAGHNLYTLYKEGQTLDAGIAEKNAFLEDEANASAGAETDAVIARSMTLSEYNDQCSLYRSYLEETGRLSSEHFNMISSLAPEGTQITAYAYSDGMMTITCVSDSKDGPAEYAERLTASGFFTDVGYPGFTAKTVEEALAYDFTITCLYGGVD